LEQLMIVSIDEKFILFSFNKTGTSSMDAALADHFNAARFRRRALKMGRLELASRKKDRRHRRRLRRNSWNEVPALKHAPPEWLAAKWDVLVPEESWDRMFRVCFVRNPFDRLLSVYSYHKQTLYKRFPEAVEAGSFESWLRMGGTGSAKKSMKRFLEDDEGNQMVDFVGRYETLLPDWEYMVSKIGLDGLELPHKPATKTEHKHWEDVYTPELRSIVLDNPVWRADVEHFGY
jgi:hypothetical protein